jgi:hypothetical protein
MVYLRVFWNPFMWLLAASRNPFMTALTAFDKISRNYFSYDQIKNVNTYPRKYEA